MPDTMFEMRAPAVPPDRSLDRERELREALDQLLRICQSPIGGEGIRLICHYVKKLLWLVAGVPDANFLTDVCELSFELHTEMRTVLGKLDAGKLGSSGFKQCLRDLACEAEELVEAYRRFRHDPEYEGAAFPDSTSVKMMRRLSTMVNEAAAVIDLRKPRQDVHHVEPSSQPQPQPVPAAAAPVKALPKIKHRLSAPSPRTLDAAHRLYDSIITAPPVPARSPHRRPLTDSPRGVLLPIERPSACKTPKSGLSSIHVPERQSSASPGPSIGSSDSNLSVRGEAILNRAVYASESTAPPAPILQTQGLFGSELEQHEIQQYLNPDIVAIPLSSAHIRPEYIDCALDSAARSARESSRSTVWSGPSSARPRPDIEIGSFGNLGTVASAKLLPKTPTRQVAEKWAAVVSGTQQRAKSVFAYAASKLHIPVRSAKCDSEGDELPPAPPSALVLDDDDSFIMAYREFMQENGKAQSQSGE